MEEFVKSPTFLTVLGLILDIIGIIILFFSHGIFLASGAVINTKKQKVGFTFLVIGFVLQLLGTLYSYNF